MRVLFLVSDGAWSARARAFVLAARGLAGRGHEVMLACESDCPVQVRAAAQQISVIPLEPNASAAADTWVLRRALNDRKVDVVFVHTDEEHLVASSALKLRRGAGAVIRRVPPFAVAGQGAGGRFASRMTPTGLLFTTAADREAVPSHNHGIPAAVAPLGIDPGEHDKAAPAARASFGAPASGVLIVCVHDGSDTHRALTALRTVALLAPRHQELHLAIVGHARQDELRMQSAALGVSSMVSFLGAREDQLSVLRAADVGWIGADGDAAAFAALDFMACRTAILAERSPLTQHYVADGIAGGLLVPADATTTAASVAAFLTRRDMRVAMGNAGRARLQREFPIDAMVDGYEQAIASAAGRRTQTVS